MANENKKITIVLDQKDTDLTFEQLGLQSDAEMYNVVYPNNLETERAVRAERY